MNIYCKPGDSVSVHFYFKSLTQKIGLLHKDGVQIPVTQSITDITGTTGNDIARATFTVDNTGEYDVYYDGEVLPFRIVCTENSLLEMLSAVQDEAQGSWHWEKTSGVLSLLDVKGDPLATYAMTESDTVVSRELTGLDLTPRDLDTTPPSSLDTDLDNTYVPPPAQ